MPPLLRTNTALWRIAVLSSLSVVPAACGARTDEDTSAPAEGDVSHGTAPIGAATDCAASVPYFENGVDTGFEQCADGRLHRPALTECISRVPRARDPEASSVPDSTCASDADCTEKPFGHCDVLAFDGPAASGRMCQYGCVRDADCGAGHLCQCADPVGVCVVSNCSSDADCGSGWLCSRGTRNRTLGCGTSYEFACELPDDACRTDSTCPGTRFGSYCAVSDDARVCKMFDGSICGRPFLVDGRPRLAPVQRSSDWLVAGAPGPECAGLSRAERQQLGRAWCQLGSMEHASVAAFARFSLQLLAVGAPAELLEQSQAAMADELLHARLCFGLASGYAGEPLGPGNLPIERALELTSLEDIAALSLHEGCVGETIAALEASEALACARDPAVRAALARIQADERRHAELGWRFVLWALRAGGAPVQRRLRRELAALVANLSSASSSPRSDADVDSGVHSALDAGVDAGVEAGADAAAVFDLTPHGILPARHRAELRAAALRDVIVPCVQALSAFTHTAPDRETSAGRS